MTVPKMWVYPCGCVERTARGSGDLERDCGNERCYRRTRAHLPRFAANRAQRRRLRR